MSESFNKGEFVSHIASMYNDTKVDAEKVVDKFVEGVKSALRSGKGVNLTGFGSFSIKHVKARQGHNPRTGEAIQIKASNQPKFKAGQNLKDCCDQTGCCD